MAKGNSPFGAWVVCVYRIEAVDSPALVNATIYAFFVFIQILAKFLVEQGRNSLGFNPTSEDCMKHLNRIAAAVAFIATTFLFSACGGESFTDSRDGQKYKTVKIGDQVWMAENLKFKGGAESVEESGARYVWDSALVACPEGWHLPSKSELEGIVSDTSIDYVWSSTEKEDLSLGAYIKDGDKLAYAMKSDLRVVRCVQGKGEQQRLQEVKGHKVIRIGNSIWMANNLNIETPTSICYLEDESECSKGRFYTISEAKNICPQGWRLPNKKDASTLINKLSKYCKEIEPYRHSLDDCSVVREFWGQKMGYYKEDGQFRYGTGSMIIGYWLLSYGNTIENHVDLTVEKIDRWDFKGKFNVRCIADTEENKE
ncbi:FISUMP domain-containing protein [uncultured Fibrobacter sp.]|nr:FISUMP domain-containing protein [uncultured Fibrobacter sp.]